MSSISIALAQLRSALFNKKANVHRIPEVLEYAASKNAEYVIFPELYLTGYSLGDRVRDLAEGIDGPSIKKVCSYAKKFQIGIIIGFPEREGESIYNTALFVSDEGDIIGKYRKIHLYDEEKKLFSAGDNLPIIDLPQGRVAMMITYDIEFPEVSRIFAVKGAQLLIVLLANMIPYQLYQSTYMRARALENQIFVVGANKVGLEKNIIFFGESTVIDPNGKTLYSSNNNEDITVTTINLSETNDAKGLLNYLENRKPDLYRKEGLLSNDKKL